MARNKKGGGGINTTDLAIGAGGIGIAYYLYTSNSQKRKYANNAKKALKDLKAERDNPGQFTKSDFKTKITEYKGDTVSAINTMKSNGCNPKHSMSYYENQASNLNTLERKSAYWKSIAVRTSKGAVGCLSSSVSKWARIITETARKLGLYYILASTVPLVIAWILKNIGSGGGGSSGGGGGGITFTPGGSSGGTSPGTGSGSGTGPTPVVATAGSGLSALGIAGSAINTVLNAAGLAAGTTVTLGASAINTVSSVAGVSVTYIENHPKYAVGIAVIMLAGAILLADPIPGDIVLLDPVIGIADAALGISLPSAETLGSAGAGLVLG